MKNFDETINMLSEAAQRHQTGMLCPLSELQNKVFQLEQDNKRKDKLLDEAANSIAYYSNKYAQAIGREPHAYIREVYVRKNNMNFLLPILQIDWSNNGASIQIDTGPMYWANHK